MTFGEHTPCALQCFFATFLIHGLADTEDTVASLRIGPAQIYSLAQEMADTEYVFPLFLWSRG